MSELGRRGRAWIMALVVAVSSSVTVGLLALLLLPSLASVARAEVVERARTFSLEAPAEGHRGFDVELDRGWSAQPAPRGGLLLRSPDRMLEVSLRAVSENARLVDMRESREGEVPEYAVVGPVLSEALENGAELSHGLNADAELVALLRPEGANEQVLATARADDPALLDTYRAELAALLLEVRAAG